MRPIGLPDFGGSLFAGFSVDIRDDHMRAFGGKPLRDTAPEALSAAGDNYDVARKASACGACDHPVDASFRLDGGGQAAACNVLLYRIGDRSGAFAVRPAVCRGIGVIAERNGDQAGACARAAHANCNRSQ